MSGTRVLVVDDDAELRDLLRGCLTQQGFAVSVLCGGDGLAAWLERERPALVVLDLVIPRVDGLSALRDLRAHNDNVPVILLTVRSDEIDCIIGLEIGADDYLGKPFLPRKLFARINAVLRRHLAVPVSAPEDHDSFNFGPFKLNFRIHTLSRGDSALSISDTEFALLKLLIDHVMQVLTREHIVELMYGPGNGASDRGIDVQIWCLRRVLGGDAQRPRYTQAVRGRNYTFVPDEREEVDEVQ